MPNKIKVIITFLSIVITTFIFFKHFFLSQYARCAIIAIIGILMVFGLWILPEAAGKIKENSIKSFNNEKK